MTSFKKTVAAAKAKVADAETKAFMARLEAIDAILEGATAHDVMAVCAHALSGASPICCEAQAAKSATVAVRTGRSRLGRPNRVSRREGDLRWPHQKNRLPRGERGMLSESRGYNESCVVKRGSDGQRTLFGVL